MKVCIAIEKFDPNTGGAERYCWDLANYLLKKGHDVAVICMKSAMPDHHMIRIDHVHALRFPQALRHLSFAVLHYLKAKKMKDYIHFCVGNTFYMDVYQPHGGLHKAWFVRESIRYPVYLRALMRLIKRLSLKDIVQRVMEWWVYTVSRPEVIAISNMVEQDMKQYFHYPPSRISLIPNGIDTERFSALNRTYRQEVRARYGMDEHDFVFVFVAQNPALKGIDLIIRACGMINAGFKVLVIGPDEGLSRRMAGLTDSRIVFGGRASDLEKIYPACDCLIHPSYYDACSLVVLEALASHIPVITSNANGAAMFINKYNGSVIPSGDVNALAEAMQAMISGSNAGCQVSGASFRSHSDVFEEVEKVVEVCDGR